MGKYRLERQVQTPTSRVGGGDFDPSRGRLDAARDVRAGAGSEQVAAEQCRTGGTSIGWEAGGRGGGDPGVGDEHPPGLGYPIGREIGNLGQGLRVELEPDGPRQQGGVHPRLTRPLRPLAVVVPLAIVVVMVEAELGDARGRGFAMAVVIQPQTRPEEATPPRHAQHEHATQGEDGGDDPYHGSKITFPGWSCKPGFLFPRRQGRVISAWISGRRRVISSP